MGILSDFESQLLKLNNIEIKEFLDSNIIHPTVLNTVLNSNKINDPKKTLYIGSTVRDFFINYDKSKLTSDLSNTMYDFYYYVEDKLIKNNTSFKDITTEFYLAIRKDESKRFDEFNNNDLFKIAFFYVYKLFIYSSLLGIAEEQDIINKVDNLICDSGLGDVYYINSEISGYEDNLYCVDFNIVNNNKDSIVGFQVKPISFINGLNTTTKYSFEKILKANSNKANYLAGEYGIHVIYYKNNNLFFRYINDINVEYKFEDIIKFLRK